MICTLKIPTHPTRDEQRPDGEPSHVHIVRPSRRRPVPPRLTDQPADVAEDAA